MRAPLYYSGLWMIGSEIYNLGEPATDMDGAADLLAEAFDHRDTTALYVFEHRLNDAGVYEQSDVTDAAAKVVLARCTDGIAPDWLIEMLGLDPERWMEPDRYHEMRLGSRMDHYHESRAV